MIRYACIFQVVIWLFFLYAAHGTFARDNSPSRAVGMALKALTIEDLDIMEEEPGYRVSVLVDKVLSGSIADQAGLKKDDIVLTVGDKGVDSPQAVDLALVGMRGGVEILALRPAEIDGYEPVKVILLIPEEGSTISKGQGKEPVVDSSLQQKLKALEDAYLAQNSQR